MRHILSIIAFLSLTLASNAQTTIVKTRSAFGLRVVFEDTKTSGTFRSASGQVITFAAPGNKYEYDKIDDNNLQVKFHVYLAFADKPDEGIEGETLLQIGSGHSKYYSSLIHHADSIIQAEDNRKFHSLLANANPVFYRNVYYTDLQTGELDFVCRFGTEDFEYLEVPPAIEWNISEETREICGHLCRKASGDFRGRTWEAWFTEDIPVSAGPWKLRGLPGTILSARDSEELIRFDAVSIEEGSGIIEKPAYPYFKTSRKKYLSMLKQYFKTPDKFISMHMSRAPGISIEAVHDEPLRKVILPEKD